MGLALTLTAALFMAALASARPQMLPYLFLGLIVFFEELGTDFTSFNGSFVFNQDFVNIFNLKFIEIITAAAYIPLVITRKRTKSSMGYEKRLGLLFTILVITLLFVEYMFHGTATVSDWRLVITGALLLHIMTISIDTEQKLIAFTKVFLLMLSVRALIGLTAFALGHGIQSPRGMVPFFWDSRQVDAFAFGIILLAAYLANYRSLLPKHKILPQLLAIIMLAVLALTVLLSIRRTIWFLAMLGVMMVLFLSKRVKLPHYFGLGFIAMVGLVVFLSLPISGGVWTRFDAYIGSVNLLDKSVADSQENQVHINNVIQYSRMIADNPSIFFLGFHGRSEGSYMQLKEQYSNENPLGQAHNGILRSVLFFGVGGLFIYLAFYLGCLFQYKKVSRLPEHSLIKHMSTGSLVFLFLEFTSALTFVPPFYTSVKGLFYTFLAAYMIRSSLRYSSANVRTTTSNKPIISKKTATLR